MSEAVLFEYTDASGMSSRTADKDGADVATGDGGDGSPVERDPLGNNVGTFTPYFEPIVYEPRPEMPMLQPWGEDSTMFINGQRVSVTLDGLPVPFSMAIDALRSGAAEIDFAHTDHWVLSNLGIYAVWNPNSGRTAPELPPDTPPGSEDDVIRIHQQADNGRWEYFFSSVSWNISAQPQTQQPKPYIKIEDLRKNLQQTLDSNNGECGRKLNELLTTLGKKFKNKQLGLTGFEALAEEFLSGNRPLLEIPEGTGNSNYNNPSLTLRVNPNTGQAYINEVIHELLHAASKSGFLHEDIVKAIAKIEGLDFKALKAGQIAEDKANGTNISDSSLFEAPLNYWINQYCAAGGSTFWNDFYKKYKRK